MRQSLTVDIAVNLTDPQFTGTYHGRSKHASDLDLVVSRAKERGVERILITGTSLSETRTSIELAKKYGTSTPVRCSLSKRREESVMGSDAKSRLALYGWVSSHLDRGD